MNVHTNGPAALQALVALHEAGFAIVPCDRRTKQPIGFLLPIARDAAGAATLHPATGRPRHGWKELQRRLSTPDERRRWSSHPGMRPAAVYGAVSGNAELLDFDTTACGLCAFDAWYALVRRDLAAVAARLCIVRTPSGAYHVVYRCPAATIPGNHVLAAHHRVHPTDPRLDRSEVLIETRGEGGYALCPPGEGYRYLQGDHASAPTITAAERASLHALARTCGVGAPRGRSAAHAAHAARAVRDPRVLEGGDRPWDRYNDAATTGAILELFARHGWQAAGEDGRGQRVRRPGAESDSSGTVGLATPGWFHCFSGNAHPFEAGRNYSPFQVFALLEHGGDVRAAVRAIAAEGRPLAPLPPAARRPGAPLPPALRRPGAPLRDVRR